MEVSMKKIIFNLLLIAGISAFAPRVQAMGIETALKTLPASQIPLILAAYPGIVWTICTGSVLMHELGHAIPTQLLGRKVSEIHVGGGKTLIKTPQFGIVPPISIKINPFGAADTASPSRIKFNSSGKVVFDLPAKKNDIITTAAGPLTGLATSLALAYGLAKIETTTPMASLLRILTVMFTYSAAQGQFLHLLPTYSDGKCIANILKLSNNTRKAITYTSYASLGLSSLYLATKLPNYL